MGIEIERRFLVKSEDWKSLVLMKEEFNQGYLNTSSKDWAVRVRIINSNKGFLTLKSSLNKSINHEFEYEIPIKDAFDLLTLAKYKLSKTRYQLKINGKDWVVDSFHNSNSPLTLTEIELDSPLETIIVPSWCGQEITGHKSLSNASLAKTPISKLSIKDRLKNKDQ